MNSDVATDPCSGAGRSAACFSGSQSGVRNLHDDDLARIMRAIRFVPESDQDAAWKYAADRLRPIRQPTNFVVKDICFELLTRYARHKPTEK